LRAVPNRQWRQRGGTSGWSAGELFPHARRVIRNAKGALVNRIVYIVGAVVIIIALLSFFGLR
jgi:ABC-type dipeptide/oligopeptide/nickel transport system permease subunit